MAWGALASLGTSGGSGGGSLFGNLLNNVNIGSYARRNNGKWNSKTWKDWGTSNITGDMFTDREAEYRDKQNRDAMIEASKSGGTINYYAAPSSSEQQSSSGGGMGGFDLSSMFGGGSGGSNQSSSGGLDMNSLMSLINMFSRSRSAGRGNSGIALPSNANITMGSGANATG